jgi:hypothetical protein
MSFTENIINFPSSILSKDSNSNLGKLYSAYAEQLDEIKIALGDLYLINNIKDQSGYNLDRIGELLNEPRGGMLDERYRLFLTIAIMKRLSRGDINSINSISSLILEDSILLREEFDGVPIYVDGSRIVDGSWYVSGLRLCCRARTQNFREEAEDFDSRYESCYSVGQQM